MSRLYEIYVRMELDMGELPEQEKEYRIRKKVLPFLLYPDVDPRKPKHADELTALHSRMRLVDFDLDTDVNTEGKDTELTVATCTYQRYFCGGYSEEEFEEDVEKQIERMKESLPWKFYAKVSATYLEREPDICVDGGNLHE